ncbi:glycerate kinase [uncultured Victivallis sp.]|uniref:glycerate kinase n=1 Tax=uncultured Victivallis sp. TaxID=354118 RepID=UPI0025F22471|nr:glycerate kinase [uncultured Victivallis sp.]
MKWILAPDSFKNCLRSPQVAAYLAEGIREISPGDTIIELPLADGGEGTVEAAARATGGRLEECRVSGPLGEPVMAHHALLSSGCALLELAEAAGLERIPESGRDPLRTTTFGVGEQLRNLLDAGIRNFVIGIGGSATVDGGIGLFQALGGLCRDAAGREIPAGAGGGVLERIAFLDVAGLHPGVAKSVIRIASDVTNPLTGPRGAARIFAPQKGASPAEVERLERGLIRWAELWNDPGDSPGDGAAGGVGFLLRKLGGRMESGAALLLDLAQFDRHLDGTDWVVTGEGRTDFQSLDGKLCAVVAARAAAKGVRTILCSGSIEPDFRAACFAGCFSVASGPGTLEQAFEQTPENLRRMGRSLAGILKGHL